MTQGQFLMTRMDLEDFILLREEIVFMFGNDALLRGDISKEVHHFAQLWNVSLVEVLIMSYICAWNRQPKEFWGNLLNKYSNTGGVPQIFLLTF